MENKTIIITNPSEKFLTLVRKLKEHKEETRRRIREKHFEYKKI